LNALSRLKLKHPEIHLVLAGAKKGEYSNIRHFVVKHNLGANVSFLGYVSQEDMPHLFHSARALVFPTFFGPTNIPPLEAMSMGCPVAVSNIYGMPEQLRDAALYFDPTSDENIASCMERLWIDDRLCESLRQRGLARIHELSRRSFTDTLRAAIEGALQKNAHAVHA
jgi:glycosyltransferase involved in cell wall biosynthesis